MRVIFEHNGLSIEQFGHGEYAGQIRVSLNLGTGSVFSQQLTVEQATAMTTAINTAAFPHQQSARKS